MSELSINRIELPTLGKLAAKYDWQSSRPANKECRIAAKNDLEAISDWLQEHAINPGTHRIYKREAIRFLLWCLYKRGVMLSYLSKDDLSEYFKFLQKPDKKWCTDRGGIRNGDWRPFIGPLGKSSYRTAVQVINSLLEYLANANYLSFNPMKLLNKHKTFSLETDRQKYKVWERILEDDEWHAIQQTINDLPVATAEEKDNKERTQFLVALLYLLGLRISEVANSTWGCFRKRQEQWWFFVEGKGGKLGHIPVNQQLLDCVKNYRLYLDKSLLPHAGENDYLIVSKKTKKPLGVRQLRELIKQLGIKAALYFSADELKQQKLKKFSPHWLRHLSATHQDRAGVPFTLIKTNHRHSSSQTTQIYVHADDDQRFFEMQKIGLNITSSSTVKLETTLEIMIKPTSANTAYSFGKFMDAVENQVLKNVSWHKNIDFAALDYEACSRLGKSVILEYKLNEFTLDVHGVLKQDILQEAELRHFKSEVKIY